MTTWTVSIFLLKDEVRSYENALKDPLSLIRLLPRVRTSRNAVLYVKKTPVRPPRWKRLLSEGFDLEKIIPESASTSAVLFLEVQTHKLALAFGHGHAMLDGAKLVHHFGLKASLGLLDAAELRSVDAMRPEVMTLRKKHQVGRLSPVDGFEIDLSADFLRSATGRAKDRDLAKMVTGATAVKMTASLDYSTLPKKCERALKAYTSKAYRENFAMIDNLLPEKDPAVIGELEKKLLVAINDRKLEQISLAPPQITEHGDMLGFKHTKLADFKPELDIADYFPTHSAKPVSLKKIRRDMVYSQPENGDDSYPRWKLFDCIIFECVVDNRQYVLAEGAWYCVSTKFRDQVDQFFQERITDARLPTAGADEHEPNYCKRAGDLEGIFLFDCHLFPTLDAASKCEFCDLFTNKQEMVHIKSGSQRSSTLSHLFRQGVMSGEVFCVDPGFRQAARERISALHGNTELIPEEGFTTKGYTVRFGIIDVPRIRTGRFDIPFFSKVTFRQAAVRLAAYGYKVEIFLIERKAQ